MANLLSLDAEQLVDTGGVLCSYGTYSHACAHAFGKSAWLSRALGRICAASFRVRSANTKITNQENTEAQESNYLHLQYFLIN